MRHDGVKHTNGHEHMAGVVWPAPSGQPTVRPLDLMRAKLDKIFRDLGMTPTDWAEAESAPEPIQPQAWDPDIAIYRKGDTVVVRADLPEGIDKDHVHVDVAPDALLISGEVPAFQPPDALDHHRSERNHGTFYRAIPLVEGADAEHCAAHFKDGVLEVEFELPHEIKPKLTHIDIE